MEFHMFYSKFLTSYKFHKIHHLEQCCILLLPLIMCPRSIPCYCNGLGFIHLERQLSLYKLAINTIRVGLSYEICCK